MKHPDLPYRQIHLDFHTGPKIPDVGTEFDAREFARTMKRAHVNSVTVFAKCHHGHLYYSTKRPERHPRLASRLDLLAEQIEALHREGIRAPIYLSVQVDEYSADTHPEWIALNPDNSHVTMGGVGVFKPGWQILDMDSAYQDFLAEQTAEVLRLFKPVDGIFFDMCWDQPSCSNAAIHAMVQAGLNPEKEEDRQCHAHAVAHKYMQRFHRMVLNASRNATVYFNARQHRYLGEESRWQEQIEIEALPTGGWNYLFFSNHVRYARHFDRPYLGMTARFFKSWADFGGLKPYAALEYETSQMVAHGARCSIGDQMHPRGTLDAAAYDLIGRVYRRIEEREPWLTGARPMAEMAAFQDIPAPGLGKRSSPSMEGMVRMLTQLKRQFESVQPDSDWEQYPLLILPDTIEVTPAFSKRLRAYLRRGGKLLATGRSGLSADGTAVTLPELGIRVEGSSPFTTSYLRFGAAVNANVPATDHVNYERTYRVRPRNQDTKTVCRVVDPYFERGWNHFCSHFQTPTDRATRFAAATLNEQCAYIAFPIFLAFAQHGNFPLRLLVRNLLAHLLPAPLVQIDAPTGTEVTVARQRSRMIVHLLHYSPERRAGELDIIEDIVPLFDLPLILRTTQRPKSVYLAPGREPVPYQWDGAQVHLRVPEVRGHQMVVFEGA